MIVRIAAVQYLLRSIHDWSGFENQVRFVMQAAGDYRPHFVLLPEIFTTQLLSFMDTRDLPTAVRGMQDYTNRYVDLMKELAQYWRVFLIGGSHPTLREDGKVYNTGHETWAIIPPSVVEFNQEVDDELWSERTLRRIKR